MNFSISPHPAQARHPVTDEPLVHSRGELKGQPVSLLPKQRAVRLDGIMIGYYCTEKHHVTLIYPIDNNAVLNELDEFLKETFSVETVGVSMAPRVDEVVENDHEAEAESNLILPASYDEDEDEDDFV